MRLLLVLLTSAFLFSGCGKTPEEVGKQPRQLLNKVEADVNKAMQKGAEQRQDAEKKE